MSHKKGVEALNNSLGVIRSSKSIMVGIIIFLAGDFYQILSVLSSGTRANKVQACIKASIPWPQTMKLFSTKV